MDTTTMMRRRNLRVTEQLLGELEAKRFDSALTRRILEPPSAFPRLLRACFLAQDGKLARARKDVDEAIEFGGHNPVVGLVAGMILYATRDYQRAIEQLDEVARTSFGGAAHRARLQIIRMTTGLGWDHDARACIEAAIASEHNDPPDPSWHAEAVRLFARGRDWHAALDHAVRALALEPGSARMWMEAAGLHARLGHRDQAVDAIARALELARAQHPDDELSYLREAARAACDAGEFELAQRCIERGTSLDPQAADLHALAAELALWRGDADAAAAALAGAPEAGPTLRVRGALEVRAGRFAAALEPLTQALAEDPDDSQAHVWRGEAYLRLGRLDEAHAELHAAAMASPGFLVVAWLLRFLVAAQTDAPGEQLTPNRTEEFELALRELCPAQAERALASMRREDLRDAVEAALAALCGNRSVYPTRLVDGALVRLQTRGGCRYDSRWALQLVRVAAPEQCFEHFDEIIARYPGSSLPLCHRGELKLWLGDLDGARADLEAAIAIVEGTRWAYMGLSTLDLLRGDPEACLATNARGVRVMQNSEGPAIHVFRGEAKRKLGRLDEAIAELAPAVETTPARASATINLALCFARTGERAGFDRLWRRLAEHQAPGLLSDAARELGLTIFADDDGEPPSDAVKLAVLERALEMFGGNRSSGLLSYRTAAGALRFVPVWSPNAPGPHERNPEHLEQAKRILLKALAHYKGPRPP